MGLRLSEIPEGTQVFVDANIFLYSAFDHPIFGRHCREFLSRVETREIIGCSTTFVINEVFHKLMITEAASICLVEPWKAKNLLKKKPEIVGQLELVWEEMELIKGFNLRMLDATVFPEFIDISRRYNLMATDAVHAATMMLSEVTDIATNDRDFERVEGVTTWRP